MFCLAVPFSQAQLWKMRRWEAVVGVGPSFFFGDIGGFSRTKNILGIRDLTYLQTRFDVNGNLKFRITRDINARVSLTYALLRANDDRGSNEERAFDATTSIFEPTVIGEYYFIKNLAENSYLFVKGKERFIFELLKSLDFYAFAGVGGVSYSVKGNDALIDHGMETGGFSAVIPAGLGATLIFSPNLNFGVEAGGRYAFTDYLDGYTSQYSKANDVYYSLNFTVTYKLKTGPRGLPSFR
ncbi:MAG: hypothetical protein A2V50_06965 [Bacteroidetes bacterium RBG_19FT_COMBO_42_10]|nr:MAG: hypothetical protein A2V50_06965 [Bacteroidetes bacterium RBG_19FT_COMBO_42_10]